MDTNKIDMIGKIVKRNYKVIDQKIMVWNIVLIDILANNYFYQFKCISVNIQIDSRSYENRKKSFDLLNN